MVPLALARWHKVLKSGCEVEEIAHRTAERLKRAVTVNAAWRLAAMTLLGRETPELPAEVMFSDIEIGVLRDFAADRKLPAPLDLGTAVLTMAMLGGYRKHDGPPGYKVGWQLATEGAGLRVAEPGSRRRAAPASASRQNL